MKCRSCGNASFGNVIDLGLMPLVNNLLDAPDQHCPRYPLKVVFCRECSLAQLTETPPPSAMFDEYLYFSSQSQTMVTHAGDLVRRYIKPGQRVVEIASNDGYLLKQAKARGAAVLGIDPARNVSSHANSIGVPTRCEYFNESTANSIVREFGKADVIFAINVLAHVPDPNEIAAGIKLLLADAGVAHIEVPYIVRMIDACSFDTIYHEHHCYFSVSAIRSLFNRHGMCITECDEIEIHGGSLHLQIRHEGDESNAMRWEQRESRMGLHTEKYYADFESRVRELGLELERTLDQFETVAAYGAAAKGVILLNHFRLDSERIVFVADVSPHKQGRYIPGTQQPIVPPEMLLDARPDAALLLAWNIKEEIARRNRGYLSQGGRFIVPIPRVQVVQLESTFDAALIR